MAGKAKRLEKIREAKAALEAAAEAKARAEREAEAKRKAEGRKRPGKNPKPPSPTPEPKAQRSFTDPESRVLLTKDDYIQGWNAHAAVDGAHQIIVAQDVTPSRAITASWCRSLTASRRTSAANPKKPRLTAAT